MRCSICRTACLVFAILWCLGGSGCTRLPGRVDSAGRSPADPDVPRQEPVPWAEPISVRGNPVTYSVDGVVYRVLDRAAGYRETGVASWYGQAFHGKLTSNGEIYDMYGYTAAHKTLPLPSYVRVTNLENGRQVVVRINDRGPFVKNRLIDLSYTAARKLDMIGPGTARVEVEVLGARDQDSDESERGSSEKSEAMAECPVSIALQVAAFGSEANAVRLQKRLLDQGFEDVVVVEVEDGSMARYKVRVVSIQDEQAMHVIIQRLLEAGYRSPGQVTQRSLCGQ